MFQGFVKSRGILLSRIFSIFVAISFLFTCVVLGYAQAVPIPSLVNGVILTPTSAFNPVLLRAIEIDPQDPFRFGFIVDNGDTGLEGEALTEEAKKLIRYFLASLTTPEEDMWVNLSPYEADRIIPESFGQTQMGRDLLAQDYILKQLTASLIYPEDELGKQFWQKVYRQAYEQYGTTDIPIDTFNKVWIMPKKASVHEHNNRVFVIDSELTVMMEEDFLAMQENRSSLLLADSENNEPSAESQDFASAVIRAIVIPEIKREVNYGKHFANLRQIYHAMILSAWYKNNLKESLLGQIYVDQNKIKGIDLVDASEKERIYNDYLATFKQGVYNFIKIEHDQYSGKHIPRKYFSGGFTTQKGETNLSGSVEYAMVADAMKKLSSPSGNLTYFIGQARPVDEGDVGYTTTAVSPMERGTDKAMVSFSIPKIQRENVERLNIHSLVEKLEEIFGPRGPCAYGEKNNEWQINPVPIRKAMPATIPKGVRYLELYFPGKDRQWGSDIQIVLKRNIDEKDFRFNITGGYPQKYQEFSSKIKDVFKNLGAEVINVPLGQADQAMRASSNIGVVDAMYLSKLGIGRIIEIIEAVKNVEVNEVRLDALPFNKEDFLKHSRTLAEGMGLALFFDPMSEDGSMPDHLKNYIQIENTEDGFSIFSDIDTEVDLIVNAFLKESKKITEDKKRDYNEVATAFRKVDAAAHAHQKEIQERVHGKIRDVAEVVTASSPGGILMSASSLDLEIRRDANSIPLPVSEQPLEIMNIQGFTFEIMGITPIKNLLLLSGLSIEDRDDAFSAGPDQPWTEPREWIKAEHFDQIGYLN